MSFPIKLEAPKHPEPHREGLAGAASLVGVPARRQGVLNPQDVPVLVIREILVVVFLDEP